MKEAIVIILFVAAVVAFLIWAAISRSHELARCTDNGGTWMRENCHLVEDQNCITMDYGGGQVVTSCMPSTSEVCNNVCRGARAEVDSSTVR